MEFEINIDYGVGSLMLFSNKSDNIEYQLKYEFKYDDYDKLICETQSIIDAIKNNSNTIKEGLILESHHSPAEIQIEIEDNTLYFIIYEYNHKIAFDTFTIGIPITDNIIESLINKFSRFLYILNVVKNNYRKINK